MNKIQSYIKKCRKAGFSDEAIKKYLLSFNAPESLVDEAFRKLEFYRRLEYGGVFAIMILVLGIFAFNPQFMGFVTQDNNLVYTDNVSIDLQQATTTQWTPGHNGELTSLLVSGRVIGNGSVKMFIIINDTRYMIIDTSTLKETNIPQISGLVIGNETDAADEQTQETPTKNTSDTTPQEEMPTQGEETISETVPNELVNDTIITETNETISLENNETVINETLMPENNSIEIINETIIENNESMNSNNSIETINETLNEINETPPESNETVIDLNETTPKVQEFENVCEETCTLPPTSNNYILEFEIEGDARIIIDNLKYTITEIAAEENLTTNTTENITTNITINETTNITENITTNETINITSNQTTTNLTINETLNLNTNETETNATINSSVEIDKPVKWFMKIDKTKTPEIILPKEAYNITTKANINIKINNNTLTKQQYNQQKTLDILKKDLTKLQKKTLKQQQKQNKNKKTTTATTTPEITNIQNQITQLDQTTTNITIDQNITLEFTNETTPSNETNQTERGNESAQSLVDIEYYTEGPDSNENEITDYNKLITISSDLHYQNIKAYTDIPETQKELINLYWLKDTGKQQITNITYVDTNNNTLIDKIEWTVPHLSNETYEVNIDILNIQSYPTVGGEWIVKFQTTGKANLTIETSNGTVFGQDIEHFSLKCGDQTLNPTYDGIKVFYPDFECNQTASHEARELTMGHHTQKFTFGNTTAYAYNYASTLPKTITLQGKLTNQTNSNINTTTNFTFSLYSAATGGTAEWTENQTLNVTEGIYTATLGANTSITLNLSKQYYLGIKINTDTEMTPRINLTSQPYAFNANIAEQALSLTCTDCIGNTEINTTGTFQIDGILNASSNITLGNSIIGTDSKPRIQIAATKVIINLQD